MKELQTILSESLRLKTENTKAVLATVVDVQGSSYRLPGARMLISETGEMFGTVSGGCLESDVLEHAQKVLQTGKPTVLIYDTSGKADSVFSLNMGCNGIIRILLEPVKNNDLFTFLKIFFQNGKSNVVATLIDSSSADKSKIGSRFFFEKADSSSNNYATEIERKLLTDAENVFASGNSQCKSYEIDGEDVEFFLEIISLPVKLTIFGAGYDAIPLAKFAKNLGWHVSVIDHRAAFATPERFPKADEILISRPENFTEIFADDVNTAAVIMTHNYSLDRDILKFLMSRSLTYIGALGPKKRTETLLQELKTAGETFTKTQLNKLYAPVGLDIGAINPETIAVSIIAEISSVLSNRQGGFLRERRGSIYDRQPKSAMAAD
jgi:xanthine dehydrogenase accessory factor